MQFHFAVHPHIRGAYCSAATCSGVLPGSSPHTWGIQTLMPASGTENRFIPTYVGHTVFIYLVFIHFAVHPHIRGAYPKMNRHLALFVGSSPHTWGIRWNPCRRSWPLRFIPTYVGHTVYNNGQVFLPPVHPHIRGAYSSLARSGAAGKRFIPTYVGHTSLKCSWLCRSPVHPHIRGAYTVFLVKVINVFGSSPHTWGIPFLSAIDNFP